MHDAFNKKVDAANLMMAWGSPHVTSWYKNEAGRVTHPGDVARQCEQAFRNLQTALEAAGCRPENVVKLTYFVTDVAVYRKAAREVGAAYRAVFGKHYPASTLVEVEALYEPEAVFEVECVALRG